MAIAFDTVSLCPNGFASWTHGCTGSDRILFVITRGALAGVTYAGVALTLVQSLVMTGTSANWTPLGLWVLLNPAAGSNAVTIAYTAGGTNGLAASYTGAGPLAGSTTNTVAAGATSLTTSLTTALDNCWLLIAEGSFSGSPPTAGTGMTLRGADPNFGRIPGLFDSNGPQTPAGLHSGTTGLASASDPIHHIMVAFAPAASAAVATAPSYVWGPL